MLRARAAARPIVRPDLVEHYLAYRAAQGMNTDHKVRWGMTSTGPSLMGVAIAGARPRRGQVSLSGLRPLPR